jgi:hypothetical protein
LAEVRVSAPNRNGARPSNDEPSGLSPVKTFFALLGVVGVVSALGLYAGRDQSKVVSNAPEELPGPNQERADAAPSLPRAREVLRSFTRLKRLWVRAYRQRDVGLVSSFRAPNSSPRFRLIDNEIRQLKRDHVLVRSLARSQRLSIVSVGRTKARIREIVVEAPKFVNERNRKDITSHKVTQRLNIVWTMKRYGSVWRLFRSVIVGAQRLH